MSNRAVANIAGDLRQCAYTATNRPALLTEAAGKLDELVTLLARAEAERDNANARAQQADRRFQEVCNRLDEEGNRALRYQLDLADATRLLTTAHQLRTDGEPVGHPDWRKFDAAAEKWLRRNDEEETE